MTFCDSLDLKWIFFFFLIHDSVLISLMVSGNVMKMTMHLTFYLFIHLDKMIPNTVLPGHFVQWWQILIRTGKGMFFCNWALLLCEGASAFERYYTQLHWIVEDLFQTVSFCASCPQSEHPPQCVIKSDMCVCKGLSDEFCYFFSVEIHETVIIVRNSNRMFMHVIISMSSQNGMCHTWKLGQVYVQFCSKYAQIFTGVCARSFLC